MGRGSPARRGLMVEVALDRSAAAVITPGGDPLEAFAGAVREFKPDWIVAGAYGHSRLGEWIFGGVTRYLLTQSERPVFLSH